MLLNLRRLLRSFKYALRGLWLVMRTEQSFRLQAVIALIAIGLMVYFRIKLWQAIAIILVIIIVLVLELINTILERLADALEPRIHPYAEAVKDLMAAAVFLASVGALIIGCLIFIPYFFT